MEMVFVMVVGSTVFELISSVFVLNGLLGKKKKVPILLSIIYVLVTATYILMVPSSWTTGCYILVSLYVRFGYMESWKDSLIATVLCLLFIGIVELLCFFPFVFIFQGRWSDTTNNLLASLCSMVLCLILSKTIPICYLKKWCSRKEVLYIAVVLVSLILMLTAIIDYHMTLELDLGDYVCVIACIILMWLLGLRLMKYRYEEKIRKKYFDAFCSVIDQMKRRQHKFRNQIDAVYSLHRLYDEYETLIEEQRKYLGKLVDYEMPTDVLILENPIIIAHMYEKITEAQEAGLRIMMKLSCSLASCGIEDIHMVEILGTFFDNAIQDMVAAGEKEFLIIEVKQEEGTIIRVANPHRKMQNKEIQEMFEKGFSTKGENRGIGLYQVRKLVQKYKVDLEVENRILKDKNYICFSLVIGKGTSLV